VTLNRVAATAVMAQHADLLTGVVLELGVGEHPFARSATTVSVDIDPTYGADIRGDAHALPLAGSSFDTVVASQVFEHLHTPAQALAEVARVLRPGGHLLLAMPFLYFVHQAPHDYQRLTRYGLERLFGDQPFDIEIRAFGGRLPAAIDLVLTSTASSSVARRAVRKARKTLAPPRPQQVTRLGRWLAARDPHEFPMGYVVVATRRAG
jgi:SAM-dependent methyltransferase